MADNSVPLPLPPDDATTGNAAALPGDGTALMHAATGHRPCRQRMTTGPFGQRSAAAPITAIMVVAPFGIAERYATMLADSAQLSIAADWSDGSARLSAGEVCDVVLVDVPELEHPPDGARHDAAPYCAVLETPELAGWGVAVLVVVQTLRNGIAAMAGGAHGFVVRARVSSESLMDAAYMAIELQYTRCELRRANERLMHADRLASIGQLTAGIAHEVNNPAASLLANLSALKEQVSSAREQAGIAAVDLVTYLSDWSDIVDEAIASVAHIRSIVRDLRSFSRIDSDATGPVDINHAIERACKLTESVIRPRARLIKNLRRVPTVHGDLGKLVQVFTNLLTNAAQAIEGTPSNNEIRISTEEHDGVVIAAVEDTGCGIPEEMAALVFEPFFTTKPRDIGNGLGLSLAAEIVRRYGGDIGFCAREGRGTRFEVRLLAEVRPVSAAVTGSRLRQSVQMPRLRILLVDDEPSILRAFRRILAPLHDVVMAASGQQALDILAGDSSFDAVICDFSMPDVDALHVYEAVLAWDRELADRIVFCTGGPVSRRGRDFLELTSNTVLEKPVAPELLLGSVEQLGKR